MAGRLLDALTEAHLVSGGGLVLAQCGEQGDRRRYSAVDMEFRILGPLEVLRGSERIALGRRRGERCLLGLLLLDAGEVVPLDRLVDLLWDGDPPATARGTVMTTSPGCGPFSTRTAMAARAYASCGSVTVI